jgi:5-formyltetrahydrofolate cyclo-ligase
LVVVGSVAVDRLGRRIGKGEGFADLEYAMAASHHGAVTSETLVLTTVHDVQVFDQLPQDLFQVGIGIVAILLSSLVKNFFIF